MNEHDINNFTPDDFISKEDVVKIVDDVKKEADELMIKKIEHYEKEIALVREDAQVQILAVEKVQIDLRRRNLELETINKEHQKLNGELREDNKKLAKQVDDLLSRLDKLRHLGVL